MAIREAFKKNPKFFLTNVKIGAGGGVGGLEWVLKKTIVSKSFPELEPTKLKILGFGIFFLLEQLPWAQKRLEFKNSCAHHEANNETIMQSTENFQKISFGHLKKSCDESSLFSLVG